MGSFLDKPIVHKDTDEKEGNGLKMAVSAMQGWRRTMEDSHTLEPHLRDEPDCSFAAVYDGHGGDAIAYYAGREIPDKLMATAQWEEYKALEDKTVDAAAVKIGEALRQAFLDFDEAQRARPDIRSGEDQSGATAIACIITPTFIVVANAGDSRGILAKGGRVEPMSFDHKPTNAGETQRIEASGGTVTNRRVNGDLAVSRALGDFKHKTNTDLPAEQQAVSAEADIDSRVSPVSRNAESRVRQALVSVFPDRPFSPTSMSPDQ